MRKYILSFCAFSFLLLTTACGTEQVSVENTPILKIDGVEVPFLEGEQAISDALGENYSRWIDFQFPEGVDGTRPVLILPFLEHYDGYTCYTYELNEQEGDPESHDIELLGFDTIHFSIEEFKETYADYILPQDFKSWYTLHYADGALIPASDIMSDPENYFQYYEENKIPRYLHISVMEDEETGTAYTLNFSVVEFDETETGDL